MQDAGYQTALIGKWHQGLDWKLHDESEREQIRVDPNYQNFENIDFASPALKGPKDYGFAYSFGTAGSAEMNPAAWIENNRVIVIPTLTKKQAKKIHGEWFGRDDNWCRRFRTRRASLLRPRFVRNPISRSSCIMR